MRKKAVLIVFLICLIVSGFFGVLVFTSNPVGERILMEAKAAGYLSYSTIEATTLAYERCNVCHSEVKMLKYCARCGPPFIVVVHFMREHIDIANKQGRAIKPLTNAEAVTITQVWNGLIGNWEGDWPKKDLKKLLKEDRALIDLLDIPRDERPIEAALRDKTAPGAYKEYQSGG